jgi:hypothetical protein
MIRDPQDLADDLEAERVYNDKTIPLIEAFDMFDVPAFPLCNRGCGRRTSRGTGNSCGDCNKAKAGIQLARLIREHPEAFVFGFQGDDMEYGSVCAFCGNRSAVCRCND